MSRESFSMRCCNLRGGGLPHDGSCRQHVSVGNCASNSPPSDGRFLVPAPTEPGRASSVRVCVCVSGEPARLFLGTTSCAMPALRKG